MKILIFTILIFLFWSIGKRLVEVLISVGFIALMIILLIKLLIKIIEIIEIVKKHIKC